jgi:hypothetical protein
MKQTRQYKLIAILIIGIFVSCNRIQDDEDKFVFDKMAWDINWRKHQSGENDRHFMLEDLKKNHLKIGIDSIDVKNILGEPERDFNFSYNLGLYKSGFDPTFLILEFDKNGKLKKIAVETI